MFKSIIKGLNYASPRGYGRFIFNCNLHSNYLVSSSRYCKLLSHQPSQCSERTSQKCPIIKYDRHFHTSPPRNVAPIIVFAMKTIGKFVAILTGRGFRKWWASLPANRRQYLKEEFKKNKHKYFLVSGLGLALIGIYYQMHIQETPITKRKRFIALTQEQFKAVANFEYETIRMTHMNNFLPSSDPSYKRVGAITARLLDANLHLLKESDRTWVVAIIDDAEQNAFVLPGGQIFVHKGMLDLCQSDDELGFILAHEISHCIMWHGAEQVSYAHLLDFAIIAALAAIWAFIPSDGIAVVTQWFFHKVVDIMMSLPYSRKLEMEADEVGLQLAAKACFDVREGSAFWSKMALLEKIQNQNLSIEWLSTHPNHDARSTNLDALMPQALEIRSQCRCPKLPANDPRAQVAVLSRALDDEMKRRQSEPQSLTITVYKKA